MRVVSNHTDTALSLLDVCGLVRPDRDRDAVLCDGRLPNTGHRDRLRWVSIVFGFLRDPDSGSPQRGSGRWSTAASRTHRRLRSHSLLEVCDPSRLDEYTCRRAGHRIIYSSNLLITHCKTHTELSSIAKILTVKGQMVQNRSHVHIPFISIGE